MMHIHVQDQTLFVEALHFTARLRISCFPLISESDDASAWLP